MNIYAFFLGALLLLETAAAPTQEVLGLDNELETKVRDKRKIEKLETIPDQKLVTKSPDNADLPEHVVPNEPPSVAALDPALDPEMVAEGNIERVKKETCLKTPCTLRSSICATDFPCTPTVAARSMEDVPMIEARAPKAAKTIEPIYSFGPVAINSAGGPYGMPGRTYSSPQISYAPAGMQFHAVLPYTLMHHRMPQHFEMSRYEDYAPKPQIIVYDPPQPIYVAASDDSSHESSPMSLYCETLKKKDLGKEGKALAAPEPQEETNSTLDDKTINEHIQRVNEIKEEISQLNSAAQRIVDQQERMARMHQDHIAMVAAKNADPYPEHLRAYEPLLRHQMRIPPYGMGMGTGYAYGGYVRPTMPYFRNAEQPEPDQKSDPTKKNDESKTPGETPQTQPPRSPEEMRQFPYYNYGSYWGRDMAPYYPPRSETGFNVPPIFGRADSPVAGSAPKPEEVRELYSKMIEMGQKMGILNKDYQPGKMSEEKKEPEGATRGEDAINDLVYGSNQDQKTEEKPTSLDLTPVEKAPTKKDKRGLIHKNKP